MEFSFLEKLWRTTYIAASVILLLLLLHHHRQIITAPVPLDLYEGTAPQITDIIARGHNPYTREFQPSATYVYPPLYNLLVAPLTRVFDNSLQLHRSVSALFIAVACALCAIACWRHSRSRAQGLSAGVLLYAALLFYGTPVASTNAPGVALYLAGLVVPWLKGFSRGSLVFALLCGVLSFYTKQYFILGTAVLCLYLFLFVSMARGLLLGLGFALCLLGSLALVHKSSPYYLDNTLFTPQLATRGLQMWEIMLLQLRLFGITYAGLLVVVLLSALSRVAQWGRGGLIARVPHVKRPVATEPGGPLLSPALNYFWFWFFWASLANILVLGKNPGNFMTYLFQLMSAPLIIAGLGVLSRLQGSRRLFAPLVLVSFYQAWAILPKDFSTDLKAWERVESYIGASEDILASQMLITTLMDQGKRVYQNGHTFYFPLAAGKPELFIKQREEDRVSEIWREYITELYRKIERQEFDLILVSPWEMRGIFLRNPPPHSESSGRDFLREYYEKSEHITLSMTDRYGGGAYKLQIWRPKPPEQAD